MIEQKELTQQELIDLIRGNYKVAITGAPKSGKTTFTDLFKNCKIIHGDDYIKDFEWSQQSAMLANLVNEMPNSLIIEGVVVPRAIRKGMKVDCVVYLVKIWEELTNKQVAMGKGIVTVLNEVSEMFPELPIYVVTLK